MTDGRFVESCRVEISRQEAFRYLGMRKRGREPRPAVLRTFEEAWESAAAFVSPRAVVLIGQEGLPGSQHIEPDARVALAACTIGIELERRVEEIATTGSTSHGMMLDAIGSAAIEAVADHMNGLICTAAEEERLYSWPRESPGYGRWKIEEQRLLFDLLQPDEIELTLNQEFVMSPAKSVTFAVRLDSRPPENEKKIQRKCARCGLRDCDYRRVSE